jgi:hypothetical protein
MVAASRPTWSAPVAHNGKMVLVSHSSNVNTPWQHNSPTTRLSTHQWLDTPQLTDSIHIP